MSSETRKKIEQYTHYLKSKGLKSTHQRSLIVEEFCRKKGHVTAEELWKKVRQRADHIGYATVYRTIKHLTESGLIHKSDFGSRQSSFEPVTEGHHDHIICLDCGDIVEFYQEKIEALQEQLAHKYGYHLVRHKLELYGHCPKCFKKHNPTSK